MSFIDDLYGDCKREISRLEKELQNCTPGDRRRLMAQLAEARKNLRECNKYRR